MDTDVELVGDRYVRDLTLDEISLIDYLSRRGYGSTWISGFLGAVASLNMDGSKVLGEVQNQGFVASPTNGMIRRYIESGDSKLSVIRKSTPAKMKEYIDLNSMSFDLYDVFQALNGIVQDMQEGGTTQTVELTRLSRTMKEIYESLQKAAEEDKIKTSPTSNVNIFNFMSGVGEMVSPECQTEVEEIIQKHMKMKREAIDVEGEVK